MLINKEELTASESGRMAAEATAAGLNDTIALREKNLQMAKSEIDALREQLKAQRTPPAA
ncbi:MAG: hypothetical protein HY308_04270 [Gammaproteobacteria bacterium]|nr:hypothetical protein [Gammaproteobacteria bacterium]